MDGKGHFGEGSDGNQKLVTRQWRKVIFVTTYLRLG